jgi:hypothetical protein
MNTAKFSLILLTYAVMLSTTGYLTFVKFVGLPTIASEDEIKRAATDKDFKKDLLDDVRAARERNGDLVKLSAHAFDVILGALLGFLSAVASSLGLTGTTSAARAASTTTTSMGQSPRQDKKDDA